MLLLYSNLQTPGWNSPPVKVSGLLLVSDVRRPHQHNCCYLILQNTKTKIKLAHSGPKTNNDCTFQQCSMFYFVKSGLTKRNNLYTMFSFLKLGIKILKFFMDVGLLLLLDLNAHITLAVTLFQTSLGKRAKCMVEANLRYHYSPLSCFLSEER